MSDVTPDTLDAICANSYRNFHVKGFDYLCLKRSPELTRKVYFFGDNLADLPEIVMPHDHRYAFNTAVIAGSLINHTYAPSYYGPVFDYFRFLTPLNGGDGFEWAGEVMLRRSTSHRYGKGQSYCSFRSDIHTLQVLRPDTIIMLDQYEDAVPVGVPTSAYRLAGSRTPPNLDGLYDRMDPDHALRLLARLGLTAFGD